VVCLVSVKRLVRFTLTRDTRRSYRVVDRPTSRSFTPSPKRVIHVTNKALAHPITSSPFPSALYIASLITSKISRDNFSIFHVVTGKIVRSGFAFVLDADPVHKARTISNPEITTA